MNGNLRSVDKSIFWIRDVMKLPDIKKEVCLGTMSYVVVLLLKTKTKNGTSFITFIHYFISTTHGDLLFNINIAS